MNRLPKLPEHRQLTAWISKEDGWYIGFVEEIPGANAQERTQEKCLESLRQAVRDIREIQRETLIEHAPRHRFREIAFSV